MLETESIKKRIGEILNVKMERLSDVTSLQDLVTDSFILIDMVIDLQNTFGVRLNQEDLIPVRSVGDLISVLQSKMPSTR